MPCSWLCCDAHGPLLTSISIYPVSFDAREPLLFLVERLSAATYRRRVLQLAASRDNEPRLVTEQCPIITQQTSCDHRARRWPIIRARVDCVQAVKHRLYLYSQPALRVRVQFFCTILRHTPSLLNPPMLWYSFCTMHNGHREDRHTAQTAENQSRYIPRLRTETAATTR